MDDAGTFCRVAHTFITRLVARWTATSSRHGTVRTRLGILLSSCALVPAAQFALWSVCRLHTCYYNAAVRLLPDSFLTRCLGGFWWLLRGGRAMGLNLIMPLWMAVFSIMFILAPMKAQCVSFTFSYSYLDKWLAYVSWHDYRISCLLD